MRKYFALAAVAAIGAAVFAASSAAQAQPYYGGMMGGYSHRYMMGPGYGGDYGYGPGMMYGNARDGRSYRGGQVYRGKRLCWRETDTQRNLGYYEPCAN